MKTKKSKIKISAEDVYKKTGDYYKWYYIQMKVILLQNPEFDAQMRAFENCSDALGVSLWVDKKGELHDTKEKGMILEESFIPDIRKMASFNQSRFFMEEIFSHKALEMMKGGFEDKFKHILKSKVKESIFLLWNTKRWGKFLKLNNETNTPYTNKMLEIKSRLF